MATIFANNRKIEIPEDADGSIDIPTLRRISNIPGGRALIQQDASGANQVLPTHGRIKLDRHNRFIEAPRAKRG